MWDYTYGLMTMTCAMFTTCDNTDAAVHTYGLMTMRCAMFTCDNTGAAVHTYGLTTWISYLSTAYV